MKPTLKIALLALALVMFTGCSAQRRAERLVRRAVNLCPALVQMKAYHVDTVLTAPAFADKVAMPLSKVLTTDTLYAATDHGTFVVSVSQSDSSLSVGFVAAPQRIHFQDTVRYSQVVTPDAVQESRAVRAWRNFAWWLAGFGISLALCVWVLGKILKNNNFNKNQ